MFSLLVGFEVAGILGGLFAVPIAGVIWVLVSAAYRNLVNSEPLDAIAAEVPRHIRAVDPLLVTGSAPAGPADPRG
jgi:hypothetical protein